MRYMSGKSKNPARSEAVRKSPPAGLLQQKTALRRFFVALGWASPSFSALTCFEARIGLANHEDLAATADDFAVAVTGLRRLQGGQDLHD